MSDAPQNMTEHYREQERRRILEMKPGPELDVEVAEKVMWWRKKTFPGGGGGFTAWVDENEKVMKLISNSTMSETCYRCDYFRPSTDIAAAWEVVEKLKQVQITITVMHTLVHCKINAGFDRQADVTSETAPEAICKAALLARLDGQD